jgi:DNA-binding CsgD family transcriptional regulator
MGIFLFLLNCFLFYWYITLLATRQAEETLAKLRGEAAAEQKPSDIDTDAATPFAAGAPLPVWTPQAGLTDAFAVKYKLSRREKQSLELLLSGMSDKEIAAEMGVSISSVGVYLRRLYGKTGSTSRFDLLTLVHTGKTLG